MNCKVDLQISEGTVLAFFTFCQVNAAALAVMQDAVEFYKHDLPHAVLFLTKYQMWVNKWKQHGTGPQKLVDVFHACDITSFPNVHVLLHLALTLPIISCKSERSF